MKIDDIKLKVISDSRGHDTLEVTIRSGCLSGSASVPSGKSTGATEAVVLPPVKALEKTSWLVSQFKDHDFITLDQFDHLLVTLDGTEQKSNLGGNLTLALSMAFARLLARSGNLELFELLGKISGIREPKLPLCFFNLIEGGVHARNSLPFQEYLFIPQTDSPKESLDLVQEFIKLLAEYEHEEFGKLPMGDEGGFTVPSKDPEMGLKILHEVMNKVKENAKLGIDVAASTFFEDGNYRLGEKMMGREDLLSYYQLLTANYQPLSIEDPFDQEDWQGFSNLHTRCGNSVWIVGDDLVTTNIKRIKKAHELQAVNAIIIKPNQIGTISETIQAALLAKNYGWKIIVSHRAGETMDTFIADLAVGLGVDGLKSGCPLQKERLVKYERLVEIEKLWLI